MSAWGEGATAALAAAIKACGGDVNHKTPARLSKANVKTSPALLRQRREFERRGFAFARLRTGR
jgi:hypothetical protein